ncbi:MAG: sugar nucleotide-binding protein [Candidatus Omnitrophica bacterium]|nr:sugar nucleotide-binding protein [Candidatus Omnitrophota bacterium]
MINNRFLMRTRNNIIITGITSIHGWPIFLKLRQKYGDLVHGICPLKMSDYFQDTANIHYCDIEDFSSLKNIFDQVKPGSVLHAGGVCDLDMCEDSPHFAYKVNVDGAKNIIELSNKAYVLYISSDLVFSGCSNILDNGYTENCSTDPVSVVGKTYVCAETEILKHNMCGIIRLALPIGPSISGTKGAVDFISKRLAESKKMTLFHDEIRSLITTRDLAKGIVDFFDKRGQGVFHFGGPKEYSLYDIGEYLVRKFDYSEKYLISASRLDEKNGPPRIGRVTLDSTKIYDYLDFIPEDSLICAIM